MFLVLFVLSLLFYLERTCFVDPCYAVFNLLYYHDYVIEAGRIAAVLPQSLALVAIKLHLPLKAILMVYSFSFVLLYYLIYLLIAYGFKLDRLALAVPLVLLLGVKYSFFWISTETHQALVYTILFYAFLTWSMRFKPGALFWIIRLAVATAILFLCFYSHPVSMFTVLFVLGFFVIDNKLWFKPEGYLLGVIIVALALFKFLTSSSGYESFFFKGFGEFFERIGVVSYSESYKFLKTHALGVYFFSLLLFLATTAWYIMMKQYLKLAYYLVFMVLFSLVLFTTFNIWYYPFIQEKNLMGLNILLLIPFLKDVIFPGEKKKLILQVILVLVFFAGVFRVADASRFYKNREAYISNLVKTVRKYPEKKFILAESMVDRNQVNVYWGFAPETLILSSLEGPDSSVSMYINDTYGKIEAGINFNDPMLYICAPWAKNLDVRRLDKRYFNLDNSTYRVLTDQDLLQGKDVVVYTNTFDDRTYHSGNDSCRTDSSGNTWFETGSEFSPGFYGLLAGITKNPAIMITATVRVYPMESLNPKWLTLVISKEQKNVVLEYYIAGVQPADSLKLRQWNTITVSGIVRSTDPANLLKVYLWNPEKKRLGMDDFRISYRALTH